MLAYSAPCLPCRFPEATCATEDGGEMNPCIRRAKFISDTKYECVVPSRRSIVSGQPSASYQKMQFSPYAPQQLKDENPMLYEEQFRNGQSAADLVFHLKFTQVRLESFSAPVNAPELATDRRSLLIDATGQKVNAIGAPPACLNFQQMHRQGALTLALRNAGATVATKMIPLQIDNVLDALGGCAQLEGFCVGQVSDHVAGNDINSRLCAPTQANEYKGNPIEELQSNGKVEEIGCCEAKGMDPETCCPDINDPRWQQDPTAGLKFNHQGLLSEAGLGSLYDPEWNTVTYKGKCNFPNVKKYPERVADTTEELCPVTINWRLPTIRLCRGGLNANEHCTNDAFCGTGLCVYMPMNSVLQISTNDGQEYSGPSSSAILFYNQPNLLSIFPSRVVKDCGESAPGRRDCGWGQWWQAAMLPADSTKCGLETFCARRQQVELKIASGLVTNPCSACNEIFITDESFNNVKCKFQVGDASVLAAAKYTGMPGYSLVTCPSPVLNEPSRVLVSVALDGQTFVGEIRPSGGGPARITSMVFIRRPEVTAVVPTNGIFDANTEINITGKYFCNDTAAMPCRLPPGQVVYDHWCIFDFMAVNPVRTDGWEVARRYSPAVIINENRITCRAPVIKPDAVPARPRALVGVLLHGIWDSANAILRNPSDTIRSEAFYIYHGRPTALRLMPGAGAFAGGTRITIDGQGIFDTYRGCKNQGVEDDGDLPIGWPATPTCSLIPSGKQFVPKAYCRFGDSVVEALISVPQAATDPFNRNSLVCVSPAKPDPSGSDRGYTISDISFSINGKPDEFSNAVPYIFAAQKVRELIPTTGSAGGNKMLTVRGSGFVNSPQLTCFFTPDTFSAWDATISKTDDRDPPTISREAGTEPIAGMRLATKATFLDSDNVVCRIPSAWEYPLKCTCKCSAHPVCPGALSYLHLQQTRTNLTMYEFPSSAPWTAAARTVPIFETLDTSSLVEDAKCTPDESYNLAFPTDRAAAPGACSTSIGSSCQVRVQVGMNVQQLSHEDVPVAYVYDIRMPEVHSVHPTAGPISGDTLVTIKGDRFPPHDGDGCFVTPRCVFGPNLMVEAARVSSTELTCRSPRACAWNIYSGGVGVAKPGEERHLAKGPPAPGTPCKFPFVWPPDSGKRQTSCVQIVRDEEQFPDQDDDLDFMAAVSFFGDSDTVPTQPFCAATSNFALDKQWGLCSCNMTAAGPIPFALTFNLVFFITPDDARSRQFVYYNDMDLRGATEEGLYPVSGTSDSPTTLTLKGGNFSNVGQTIYCFFADNFGVNVTTLATPVSDSMLECLTPPKSDEMDFSIFVSITGNMQQFSDSLAFMYFLSPIITKIHPTPDTIGLLKTGQIDASLDSRYNMAAGPTAGGTRVTINGLRILDKARCPVKEATGLIETELGLQSCSKADCPTQMQCQFPFYYQKQGAAKEERYDACTEDDVKIKLGTRVAPGTTWCMVNYRKPGNVVRIHSRLRVRARAFYAQGPWDPCGI